MHQFQVSDVSPNNFTVQSSTVLCCIMNLVLISDYDTHICSVGVFFNAICYVGVAFMLLLLAFREEKADSQDSWSSTYITFRTWE